MQNVHRSTPEVSRRPTLKSLWYSRSKDSLDRERIVYIIDPTVYPLGEIKPIDLQSGWISVPQPIPPLTHRYLSRAPLIRPIIREAFHSNLKSRLFKNNPTIIIIQSTALRSFSSSTIAYWPHQLLYFLSLWQPDSDVSLQSLDNPSDTTSRSWIRWCSALALE